MKIDILNSFFQIYSNYFFKNLNPFQLILVFITIFIIVFSTLKLMLINKKTLFIITFLIFNILFGVILSNFVFKESELFKNIVQFVFFMLIPIGCVLLITPDLREKLTDLLNHNKTNINIRKGDIQTRKEIVDAVFELSSKQIGAIITIEKYQPLDKFTDKAIILHSKVTKELLLNIFIPGTKLHDGAVIIRGDEIICAAAYFNLTQKDFLDKSIGSRHRAAIGISEESDALTIICSEETGTISITINGNMNKIETKAQLERYLNTFI